MGIEHIGQKRATIVYCWLCDQCQSGIGDEQWKIDHGTHRYQTITFYYPSIVKDLHPDMLHQSGKKE